MTGKWVSDAGGSLYEIEWGGTTWTLRVDDPEGPGLRSARIGPLLSLEGLARSGFQDPKALTGASLVGSECRFGRVEATYQPAGWDDLTVRAAWGPTDGELMDLEIQISALSVDRLRQIEVSILSVLDAVPPAGSLRSAEPRDREAAALSYDGRETDLARFQTGPPGDPMPPWLASRTGRDGYAYIEMIAPGDASRRIMEGTLPFSACRYALFGYDLEKGVVLRARIRGAWLPKATAFSTSERLYREFLDEPPPLRT